MSPAFAPCLLLGAVPNDANSLPILAGGGFALAGLLGWLLWRAQQRYAIDLQEQARLLAEEQARSEQAQREKDSVARESQAKSEMLATLSREIRAHLNGIIGSADLMLEGSPKAQDRDHLTTLRSSAESLHQSLNDVFDYARIETGQIQIARAPFDLRQPLVDAVEQLSPLARLKGLELVLIVSPDVPLAVTGDAGRLRQILLNLMSNAIRFTGSGRVVLRVETSAGSNSASRQGATWLHFSVSDTGPGIPENLQATLFDRADQTDPAASRKFGGSGLDLVISRRLVELMGGTIGARNLAESGSEFWVVLPFVAERPPARIDAAPFEGVHVVVLGELAASRVAVSAMLSRLGIDHDATDTLAKASQLVRDAFDSDAKEVVLMLDESLALRRAQEINQLLARDGALSAARVILLSGHPEAGQPGGPAFPATAVLRKPLLRSELLLAALRQAVAVRTGRPPSRSPFDAARPPQGGYYVLVVDDDEISRSVSSQLLARCDCTVDLAVSGADAIEQAKLNRYDLIFMDCQMPVMDGFTATRRILDAGKAPPIVALTANTSAADREKCFAAGMCDFVDKPVRKAELLRVLKRWVPMEPVSAR